MGTESGAARAPLAPGAAETGGTADGVAAAAAAATEDAIRAHQRALMESPRNVRVCQQLVFELEQAGRRDEAVGAWYTLGASLEAEGRWREAEVAYREAIARKPDCLRALVKLGQTLLVLAQPARALPHFEAALAIMPDQFEARIGVGWASQLLGDVSQGWEAFAWEFPRSQTRRRHLEQPVWDGSPLDGRTILLWVDWGLGDTIQFIRYARMLADQGARVIAECQTRLVPLLERMPWIDRVITPRMPLPPFDVHAPLLLLPKLLGTTRETVPGEPYLTADATLVEAWRGRLARQPADALPSQPQSASPRANGDGDGNGLRDETTGVRKIGIAWGAGPIPPARSAPLLAFARLARVPGIRLINLQQGPQFAEVAVAAAAADTANALHLEIFAEESRSIAETAALIANLDLVITVDTMLAHLAGALGARVWTLLPFAANWRWQSRGESTAWYPGMRLFRQARPGDWAGVMEAVAAALDRESPLGL